MHPAFCLWITVLPADGVPWVGSEALRINFAFPHVLSCPCNKCLFKELNVLLWSSWPETIHSAVALPHHPAPPSLYSTFPVCIWFQEYLSLLENGMFWVPGSCRLRVVLFIQWSCPRQGHHGMSYQGLQADGVLFQVCTIVLIDLSIMYFVEIQHFTNHWSSIQKPAHQQLCQHTVKEAW